MEAGSKKENSIFFNHSFDKKRLKTLISWVFKKFGEAEALRVLDLLKETGFRHATKAGISIGVHDLTTPIQKSWLISESQLAMNITDRDFIGAKITATERSQRIIDTWHRASESLSKQVVDYFGIYDQFNPVYIMALSGARGNFSQVRQLIGMRGLMADQQGKIVNFPILSNLREGLTLTEYFISCSGARKGLVDTALRTADTGYLTRRLVDVSHNVVVKRIRCNTNRGIAFKSLQSYNKVLLALKERLVGRVLAEDIELEASPFQKKDGGFITSTGLAGSRSEQLAMQIENESQRVIAKKDQEISPKLSLKIARVRDKVFIRSPLTCGFTNEVCQLCYGWSISQGSLVSLGDAVGVIAAQSIGEPGTQLTMRTFHTGGVFSGDLLQEIRAPHPGTIQFSKAFQGLLIRTAHGRIAFLSKTKGNLILSKDNYFTEMPIQAFTMLFVKQGEEVKSNQLLAEYSIQSKEGNQPIKTQQTIFAELSGRVIEDRSGAIYTKPIKESLLLLDPLQDSFSTPFSEETKLLSSACPSLPYPFSPCACKYKASLCKKICMRNPSVPLPVPVPLRGKGTGKGKKGMGMGSPNPLKGVKATAGDGVARSSQGCTYKSSYKAKLCTCKRDLAPGALASTKRSFVRRFASASPYLPLRGTGREGLRMQIFLQSSALYLQALPYGEGVGKHGKKGIVATPLHGKKVDFRKLQKFKKEIVFLLAKKRKKETDVHTELHIANKIGKNTKKGSRALCKYKALLCKKIFTGTAVCPPTCPYLPVRLQIEDLHAQPMRFAQPAGDGGRACKYKASLCKKICMRKPRRGTQIYDLQRGTASGRAHRGKKGEKGGRRGKKGEVGGARREDNQIYKPQILSSLKNEDLENDVFKYVEPVKSGRLGFLKILSTRVGATLDYMCPIKPFDYYLIKKKRRRSALFERSNGSPFFLFSKPVLAARFLEAQLGTPVVDESKSYGKLHLEEVRRPQIGGFRFALPARTPAKGFGEEEAQVRSFASSKENDLKENTLRQNKEIRVKKAVKYLHPEYIKENRFFLQTIAEYGDIVEEEYKTKII